MPSATRLANLGRQQLIDVRPPARRVSGLRLAGAVVGNSILGGVKI
ncbi:MAG: hypothetical protein ACRD0V_14965 [Acidimicrobiales bacterium]